jgi:hypothetical protein
MNGAWRFGPRWVRVGGMNEVEEVDIWWFRELYAILAAFADDPSNTISRLGGGTASVPEDQAEDLGHFRRCVLSKYPQAGGLRVMRVIAEIDAILDRKGRGGESFEEWFWTIEGFRHHPDWARIREMSRSFLLS